MPKFAANLTMLFTELPFLERFEAAAKHGFSYVEYLFPYQWQASELVSLLRAHSLQQVLFNLPPGDWDNGERGIACLPDRKSEFTDGVELALTYSEVLKVKQLNCLAGLKSEHFTDSEQWDTLVQNVAYAAKRLAQKDMILMVEPINSRIDMPGFFIDTLAKADRLLKEVAEPNVKIQFDIYHMQIMQGDLIRSMHAYKDKIGHIQFADNPGRHEPGTGELNFPRLFEAIDQMAYSGYVSAEYIPSNNTKHSLNWFTKS